MLRCMHPMPFLDVLGYPRHPYKAGRWDADGRRIAAWNGSWGQVEEDV